MLVEEDQLLNHDHDNCSKASLLYILDRVDDHTVVLAGLPVVQLGPADSFITPNNKP